LGSGAVNDWLQKAVKACGITGMVCWVPISDVHLKYKLGQTEQVAVARLLDAVRLGRDAGLKIVVAFEDATRAPIDRVRRCIDLAVEAGAEIVSICDTMGILTPFSAYRISRELVQRIGGAAKLSLHYHNDLGMATANTLMATLAGARLITGSFAGLGERAGNVCLEEIAVILRLKYGVDTGIDTAKLSRAALRIAEIAKFQVGAAKPLIGANAFAHESGIHVQGVTNEPATYEPYPPAWVGGEHVIQFGKHSGIASMRYLSRSTGIAAGDDALEEALSRIKRRAEERGAPSIAEATAILAAVVAGT
jgi:homocitrate synthase NifV